MDTIPTFLEVDGILIEKEYADNTFFIENIFNNRFSHPYYNAFHLFITNVFPEQYKEFQASYNRAIHLLDEEDQIITHAIIYLLREKQDFSLEQHNISDFHIEELEKGYEFIVNQIKEY